MRSTRNPGRRTGLLYLLVSISGVFALMASIPIAFLNELNAVAALVLVHGADFLSTFEKPQRDALAMLFINLHGHGFDVAAIFWGLWLLIMGANPRPAVGSAS